MKIRDSLDIADSLRILRRKNRISQSKLAELSGVSQQTISGIENYKIQPSIGKYIKILKAFGCGISIVDKANLD